MTSWRVKGTVLDYAGCRHLIDQLPDLALIVADQDMRYVLAGGQALERAGWQAGQLLGQRPRDLMPERLAGLVEEHMAAALRGEASSVPVMPGARADAVWEAWFGCLRDDAGTVTGVIFLLRDVTRQHRLSERARESQELFAATVDALLDGLVVLSAARDGSGRITDLRVEYANPVACAVSGRPLAEVAGQGVLTIWPSLASAGLFSSFARTIDTGEPCEFEVPWFEEAGAAGAFELRGSKLGDGILIAFHDITARVQSQQRLRDSEERYRVTVESAAAGIANVGLDGRFLRVNQRFCEITGYSQQELLARTFQDITHPDDLDSDLTQARQLAGGQIPWYAMEKRYLRKDGSAVWVLLTAAALRGEHGNASEYVSTVIDITEQKHAQAGTARLNAELEQRVRQRTADLQAANRNLESFTYTVSHDLRAPLTALSGFTEMLNDHHASKLGPEGRDYLARIQAAAGRMNELIDDLLALSRASRAEIHTINVNLSELARTTIAALRRHDPARQVHVTIENGVHAFGDERLLRTVLENLLSNAWKFTSKTTTAAISFGTHPSDGPTIHCYVRDNGAGFNPAHTSRLFHPFSRLHPATQFPGTGVGLASVQRIIERHHGRCWAEGQPDHGATFHFTLPTQPLSSKGE